MSLILLYVRMFPLVVICPKIVYNKYNYTESADAYAEAGRTLFADGFMLIMNEKKTGG